jgi:hypothetical protein
MTVVFRRTPMVPPLPRPPGREIRLVTYDGAQATEHGGELSSAFMAETVPRCHVHGAARQDGQDRRGCKGFLHGCRGNDVLAPKRSGKVQAPLQERLRQRGGHTQDRPAAARRPPAPPRRAAAGRPGRCGRVGSVSSSATSSPAARAAGPAAGSAASARRSGAASPRSTLPRPRRAAPTAGGAARPARRPIPTGRSRDALLAERRERLLGADVRGVPAAARGPHASSPGLRRPRGRMEPDEPAAPSGSRRTSPGRGEPGGSPRRPARTAAPTPSGAGAGDPQADERVPGADGAAGRGRGEVHGPGASCAAKARVMPTVTASSGPPGRTQVCSSRCRPIPGSARAPRAPAGGTPGARAPPGSRVSGTGSP